MSNRISEMHQRIIVMDGHNHIPIEIAKRRHMQQRAVFSTTFVPQIRQGGVDVLMMVVGGDSTSLTDGSDLLLWGTLQVFDAMWQEAEESAADLAICTTGTEIDAARESGKIAVILGLEGGRPLEGKPNVDTLATLRMYYKLGLRHVQLVDQGRNKLGDGLGSRRTGGRLSPFGKCVVKECNRLGVVLDVAHLNDPGFWDVLELSSLPFVDSHSCARAISDVPRNVSDERIKALADAGGVQALSFYDKLVNNAALEAGKRPTIEDLLRHIDHVVEVAGIDHVGIGPDHFEDHGFSPAPGWMEGVYFGVRDSYHVEGLENITRWPALTEALLQHGYSETNIRKILGENLLRVYRQVLG